jgi:hypothetical protein
MLYNFAVLDNGLAMLATPRTFGLTLHYYFGN